jgi:hypothetical protein
MSNDRTMTRFFLVLGAILAVPAAVAALVVRSWLPLIALGAVVLGVMVVSLSELALFKPLLALIMRAGNKKPPAAPPSADESDKKSTQPPV